MNNAMRIAMKVLSKVRGEPSTPGELEAVAVTHWIFVYNYMLEGNSSDRKENELQQIDDFIQKKGVNAVDVDDLMAWYTSKMVVGNRRDALAALNMVFLCCVE